nr:T-cell differentiation antigen CD6-like isoform X1 [Misgurnus anguillicaudatus]
MEQLKIMRILQIICFSLWLGYNGVISAKDPNVTVNVKFMSALNEHSGWCSWTLSSSENRTTLIVRDDISRLSSDICLSLGCGDVFNITAADDVYNSTCLTGCLYNNSKLSCSESVGNVCKTLIEVVCGSPYLTQTRSCSWTIKSPGKNSPVYVTEDALHSLSNDICHQLGCGELYNLKKSSVGFSETCLTNCVYHDYHLKNCTKIKSANCSLLSELQCGAAVRLVGGGHRCGGRVEVWRGSWGTVCDDGWDEKDAGVVCAQLGCGYAVSVSGEGVPYGQGRGPIHLDELNCTGNERSLWECPAVSQGHDCGHKEDAGVVCSEYKSLRLTGGLDRCSGRVEFHRNGTWGTVCDNCWHKDEAAMACEMLSCGAFKQFTAFDPPFTHNNETHWYFFCNRGTKSLWDCRELSNHPLLCKDSKAAGLICDNSRGMPVPSPVSTSAPASTVTMKMDDSQGGFNNFPSPELIACFVLGLLLLIAVITNIILCHHYQKKKAIVVQQRFVNLQDIQEAEENNYRDSVHLTKVTNNCSDSEVPIIPQQHIWPQSSIESGSYDTDYEQHDFSPETAFPLSTFRNSMRYSADGKTSSVNATNLNVVTEEVDSFESSSTSSEECYETGINEKDMGSLESTECYENTGLKTAELDNGGSTREDSPLYSPVCYDNEAVSESDYDDIGNYLQQPY